MAYIRVTVSLNRKIYDKLMEIRSKRIKKGENISFTEIVNEHLKKAMK